MTSKKCKHEVLECKNSDNKFYCKDCKKIIVLEEWIKTHNLSENLDFITQFRFDSKIKDEFYR